MSVSGVIALAACVSSVFSKIIFTVRMKSLERVHETEHANYQKAKNELHAAAQHNKLLEVEVKQHEGRRRAILRNIKTTTDTLAKLQTRKEEDDSIREYQKDLIKGKPQ